MKILYLGDIVGEKTIDVLKKHLKTICTNNRINMVLCNAENVTKGKGLSYKHYKELKSLGIAGITMGNHLFSKSEIKDYLADSTICVPINLNVDLGHKVLYINYNNLKIALVSIMGRVFINTPLDCPFRTFEKTLKNINADHIIVDFHGEATSEKKAFFYEFAGSVDAIIGTHTHVQTADLTVHNNTCYITDIGMCGPKNSILGDDINSVITRFKTGVFEPLQVAQGEDYELNGVILELGKTNKIADFKGVYKCI